MYPTEHLCTNQLIDWILNSVNQLRSSTLQNLKREKRQNEAMSARFKRTCNGYDAKSANDVVYGMEN